MEAGETHCPILVAHAAIPKRDAADTNETAPGVGAAAQIRLTPD